MTTTPEPNSSMWGIPPTLSAKFEPSNDLVSLVIWNMRLQTGMTLKTSRPFIVFAKLARLMVTGISADQLNVAISNLSRAGVCIVEREEEYADWQQSPADALTTFMFYLEMADTETPLDRPHEVDPKMAVKWPEDFIKLEARLEYAQGNDVLISPVADKSSSEKSDTKSFYDI